MTQTHYKYLIPIGDNCEIAGHLTKNGYHFSSLFRYARCELSQVCKCFESDFKDIFTYANIQPSSKKLVRCNKYGISWHTKFEIQNQNGRWLFQDKSEKTYKNEISKINHLIDNIRKALNDTHNRTVFIYKSNIGDFSSLDKFESIISNQYPELDFEILLVKTEGQIFDAENPKLKIRHVEYHAPYARTLFGGDDKGWNEILSEYIYVPDFKKILFKAFQPNGSETADYLRDIAFKFESIDDFDTAFELMLQAHYCRPNGPIILKKLREYRRMLDNGRN